MDCDSDGSVKTTSPGKKKKKKRRQKKRLLKCGDIWGRGWWWWWRAGGGEVNRGSKLLSVSNVGLKSPVVRADSEKPDVVQARDQESMGRKTILPLPQNSLLIAQTSAGRDVNLQPNRQEAHVSVKFRVWPPALLRV